MSRFSHVPSSKGAEGLVRETEPNRDEKRVRMTVQVNGSLISSLQYVSQTEPPKLTVDTNMS